MFCRTVDLGVSKAIVCGSRPRRTRCDVDGCKQWTVALCDHPIAGKKSKTCDAKLCEQHRTKVGYDLDRCPVHVMPEVPMSFCKTCKAVVHWYKTNNGKNIPVDPEPHPDGNIRIDVVRNIAFVVRQGTIDGPAYRSHFVTCPNAADHRRPRP